jgi:hypothetical protein
MIALRAIRCPSKAAARTSAAARPRSQSAFSSLTYVDDLVQIAVNQDPNNAATCHESGATENLCERFFWVLQDTNFNVLGVVTATGDLGEHYEYTPYGERRVYAHGWLLADITDDGKVDNADANVLQADAGTGDREASRADLDGDGDVDLVEFDGNSDLNILISETTRELPSDDPKVLHGRLNSTRGHGHADAGTKYAAHLLAGLCPFGHQGLYHDREWGTLDNRALRWRLSPARGSWP